MYYTVRVNRDLLNYMRKTAPGLSDEQLEAIAADLSVSSFSRGSQLVRQGGQAPDCYFVISGCLRMFFVDDEGRERTAEFYTEEQSLTIFPSFKYGKPSPYSVECVEDSLLLVSNSGQEQDMYGRYPALKEVSRDVMEEQMSGVQSEYSSFKASSPEERYLKLLESRPGLAARVPQHQLASYLGITPESFSRLKRRLHEG